MIFFPYPAILLTKCESALLVGTSTSTILVVLHTQYWYDSWVTRQVATGQFALQHFALRYFAPPVTSCPMPHDILPSNRLPLRQFDLRNFALNM